MIQEMTEAEKQKLFMERLTKMRSLHSGSYVLRNEIQIMRENKTFCLHSGLMVEAKIPHNVKEILDEIESKKCAVFMVDASFDLTPGFGLILSFPADTFYDSFIPIN